jgi:hypothetical protein
MLSSGGEELAYGEVTGKIGKARACIRGFRLGRKARKLGCIQELLIAIESGAARAKAQNFHNYEDARTIVNKVLASPEVKV